MVPGLLRSRPRAPAAPIIREHCVAGRTLPLRIVENARARRLTLRIDAGGKGLRITIPPGVAPREVDKFLDRHSGWLETRLAKLPDDATLRAGVRLPLRGVPHLIVHQPGRGTVSLGKVEAEPALIVHGDERHLPRRLADFLKREARRDITALVEKHTASVGRRAKAIRFKDTTSRWGSCTSDGTLSFSWRIMMAPRTVIDYLVAHEVAHLKEMNHGPHFWALCRDLCPRTDEARAWLRKNGGALQAIGFG
jgi:predicted metal-dependent hydrolase